METLFQYTAPPSPCGYLPDQLWSLEYEMVGEIAPAEYMQRMATGWRRFGNMLFRPRCRRCVACRSLRVVVDQFQPNRSQKRARRANESSLQLLIGTPAVTRAKLRLYDRYHAFQATTKDWPTHPAKDAASYIHSFVDNPFPTEEWCYYLDQELVAVGYVDSLPTGLSAIYFFYDPNLRTRGPGTWNILRLIQECAQRRIPHLYLGYFVAGCPSLAYKANFLPNELLGTDGAWAAFRYRQERCDM